MKKMLIIILMCSGISLFGLDYGLISGFEVGYNIYQGLMVNDDLMVNNNDSLYIQLKTGYRINNLRIVGTYTNTLFKTRIDNYRPVQDRFRIDVNYTWKFLTIGLFHWCDHCC